MTALVIIAIISGMLIWSEMSKRSKMSPEQLRVYDDASLYGPENSAYICPHCQTPGHVRTKQVTRDKGISGAKATGAVLTGGLSILATGLSRREAVTQAHCGNCGSTWCF